MILYDCNIYRAYTKYVIEKTDELKSLRQRFAFYLTRSFTELLRDFTDDPEEVEVKADDSLAIKRFVFGL